MRPDRHQESKMSRRSLLQSLGVTSFATGALLYSPPVRAATAPHTWQETATANTVTDKLITLSSSIELKDTFLGSTHWNHEFHLAGHGVSTNLAGTRKERDMQRNVMAIDERDSDLTTLAAIDATGNRMYPKPDDDNGESWGTVTDALATAADALGRAVAANVLTAASLADGLLDAFTHTSSSMPKTWEGIYNDSGAKNEVGHHLDFDIHEDYASNDWTDNMSIYSQAGILQTRWDLGFTEGDIYATASLVGGTDRYEWGHPESMTPEEKEYFGVIKVTRADIRGLNVARNVVGGKIPVRVNGRDITMTPKSIQYVKDHGSTYIATNPPITVTAESSVIAE
ncbi:hypothetical protein [Halomarina pelagica]|uniref:hypothetical protein n=1 Tax=Halomarina pelagica TaxID=2961599 RepID=UPI0020C22BEC|nr:hypothetical protein [Halomarina sp. BND7]